MGEPVGFIVMDAKDYVWSKNDIDRLWDDPADAGAAAVELEDRHPAAAPFIVCAVVALRDL